MHTLKTSMDRNRHLGKEWHMFQRYQRGQNLLWNIGRNNFAGSEISRFIWDRINRHTNKQTSVSGQYSLTI